MSSEPISTEDAGHLTVLRARRKAHRADVARREGRPVGRVGRPPKQGPRSAEMAVWDATDEAALDAADVADRQREQDGEDGR